MACTYRCVRVHIYMNAEGTQQSKQTYFPDSYCKNAPCLIGMTRGLRAFDFDRMLCMWLEYTSQTIN